MFNFYTKEMRSRTSVWMAITIGTVTVAPLMTVVPVSAQLFPSSGTSTTVSRQATIPAGTVIPVEYSESEKILVTKEETVPLTVTVSANIKNSYGTILIPYGSEIVGEIQPSEGGSQFVAKTLILKEEEPTEATEAEENEQPIEGASEVITTTETVEEGADAGDILEGAAIGAAAATALSAILGDQAIATEEVLGGAGLGALAGWILGKEEAELISINTDTDLDVTLESDLVLTY